MNTRDYILVRNLIVTEIKVPFQFFVTEIKVTFQFYDW